MQREPPGLRPPLEQRQRSRPRTAPSERPGTSPQGFGVWAEDQKAFSALPQDARSELIVVAGRTGGPPTQAGARHPAPPVQPFG